MPATRSQILLPDSDTAHAVTTSMTALREAADSLENELDSAQEMLNSITEIHIRVEKMESGMGNMESGLIEVQYELQSLIEAKTHDAATMAKLGSQMDSIQTQLRMFVDSLPQRSTPSDNGEPSNQTRYVPPPRRHDQVRVSSPEHRRSSRSAPVVRDNILKRVDMPVFEGKNTYSWISRSERYFRIIGVTEAEKLDLVAVSLDGDALTWYNWEVSRQDFQNWKQFKSKLLARFGNLKNRGPDQSLFCIKQKSSMQEYVSEFEDLASQVQGLAEHQLECNFLNGLSEEIQGGESLEDMESLREKESIVQKSLFQQQESIENMETKSIIEKDSSPEKEPIQESKTNLVLESLPEYVPQFDSKEIESNVASNCVLQIQKKKQKSIRRLETKPVSCLESDTGNAHTMPQGIQSLQNRQRKTFPKNWCFKFKHRVAKRKLQSGFDYVTRKLDPCTMYSCFFLDKNIAVPLQIFQPRLLLSMPNKRKRMKHPQSWTFKFRQWEQQKIKPQMEHKQVDKGVLRYKFWKFKFILKLGELKQRMPPNYECALKDLVRAIHHVNHTLLGRRLLERMNLNRLHLLLRLLGITIACQRSFPKLLRYVFAAVSTNCKQLDLRRRTHNEGMVKPMQNFRDITQLFPVEMKPMLHGCEIKNLSLYSFLRSVFRIIDEVRWICYNWRKHLLLFVDGKTFLTNVLDQVGEDRVKSSEHRSITSTNHSSLADFVHNLEDSRSRYGLALETSQSDCGVVVIVRIIQHFLAAGVELSYVTELPAMKAWLSVVSRLYFQGMSFWENRKTRKKKNASWWIKCCRVIKAIAIQFGLWHRWKFKEIHLITQD